MGSKPQGLFRTKTQRWRPPIPRIPNKKSAMVLSISVRSEVRNAMRKMADKDVAKAIDGIVKTKFFSL